MRWLGTGKRETIECVIYPNTVMPEDLILVMAYGAQAPLPERDIRAAWPSMGEAVRP